MRMFKIILLQFILVSSVVIILEVLSYFITGGTAHSIRYLNGYFFVYLAIILNPLIHERIVVKDTEYTEENQIKIKNAMRKVRTKVISEDGEVIKYKASKLYSWDGVVTIERFHDNIKITGPVSIIRKLNL